MLNITNISGIFKEMKHTTIIFIAVIIVLTVFTLVLYSGFKKEMAEKATLQSKLAEIMKERKQLSEEVEDLKVIKNDLELKAGELETQARLISENYEREKSQNDAIRAELKEKTEKYGGIESRLEAVASEKDMLQELLDAEKVKYSKLKESVDRLIEVKDVLEDKVRDIINKQGIELERIVVKAEGELEGKVLVVNREYNFIVVDMGVKDDVGLGDFLTVFRSGKYLGEAQIEKIYDTMSAATIVKENKPKAIMVDDNVIMRGN